MILGSNSLMAQDEQKKTISLIPFAGWGHENDYGNTALSVGLALQKPISKHLFYEGCITGFTTDFLNNYNTPPNKWDGVDRDYYAVFITPAFGYKFGNEASLFNTRIKAGPTLKYFNYKIPKNGLVKHFPDGREEAIASTFIYYEDAGFNISAYVGVSFDARVSKRVRTGIFIDTYSHEIEGEHFILGVHTSIRLK